ncbi:hypothetical protein, partial [Klebsiella pneumoniae]
YLIDLRLVFIHNLLKVTKAIDLIPVLARFCRYSEVMCLLSARLCHQKLMLSVLALTALMSGFHAL